MDEDTWEKICRRCGECCFEKWIESEDRIRFTRISCRHLDIVSRECRVYHKRLHVGEGCINLTPEIVRNAPWLPETCSYRYALSAFPEKPAATDPSSSSSQHLLSEPSPPE